MKPNEASKMDEASDAIEAAIANLSATHRIQVLLHVAGAAIAHHVAEEDRERAVAQSADYLNRMVQETALGLARLKRMN